MWTAPWSQLHGKIAVCQNVKLFVISMWDQYFKQDSDERRVMNEEIEKLKTEKTILMVCIIWHSQCVYFLPKI